MTRAMHVYLTVSDMAARRKFVRSGRPVNREESIVEKLHVLWDFENVQPTLDQLAKLEPGFTDLWLFHGPRLPQKPLR